MPTCVLKQATHSLFGHEQELHQTVLETFEDAYLLVQIILNKNVETNNHR